MIRLQTPPGASARFEIEVEAGPPLTLTVREIGGERLAVQLSDRSQAGWTKALDTLAYHFGLRRPLACLATPVREACPSLRPILTKPVDPRLEQGYGDPCVVRVGEGDYRLYVTSNDAADAFPILSSRDLETWTLSGFVFPEGQTPAWCLTGENRADFWAPELHRVGETWLLCFTARQLDGTLAIGLAHAASPDGPFTADETPILTGGVIDSHILVDAEASSWLVWKKDDNAVWPRRLCDLLHRAPQLVDGLFESEEDCRTASLMLTLWPWIRTLAPMEQFFVLQPLIEAGAEDLTAFSERVGRLSAPEAVDIAGALHTRIFAQRLSPDTRRLTGEPTVILQNDLPWEGHLIEGVWITQEAGRYYLLYAGNDFSTGRYGIGAAVADAPTGPYEKGPEAFLSSTADWWGPGHPSVVRDDAGGRRIFLHAFPPGKTGYKRFRALLSAPVRLDGGRLQIG
jgi:hypothetical protein